MQANEFVKKFGWERARQFINADNTAHALVFATTGVSFVDLKRLVESYELVHRSGGLYNSREHLIVLALIEEFDQLQELSQAIADVEACQ